MKSKRLFVILFATTLTFVFLFPGCIFIDKFKTADENATDNLTDTTTGNSLDRTPLEENAAEFAEQTTAEGEQNSTSLMPDEIGSSKIRELTSFIFGGFITTQPDGATTRLSSTTTSQTTTQPSATTTQPYTTAAVVAVKSITLSESKKNLKTGENVILRAAISPANATNKSVSWVSSNPDIAYVDDNGQVIAMKKGTATITCSSNDANKIKATCVITVKTGALVSYLYDSNGYFYVEDDPWQRNFGFNRLYDFGAQFAFMYYNTVRVKFKYNNLDWMIQMWKGQYGLTFIGSEIGIYTKPQTRLTEHYDCASEANSLKMEMSVYRDNKQLFSRDYATHWWITGFVPGTIIDTNGSYKDRTVLVMTARITLKDDAMTTAFVDSMEANGFKKAASVNHLTPDKFSVNGNDVNFCWRYLAQAPVFITFNPGYTTGNITDTLEPGSIFEPPAFTREGYALTGWLPEMPDIVPGKNTVYTAQWSVSNYTISFNANGGSGQAPAITQAYNTVVNLPGSGFEKPGCTFIGWHTSPYATHPFRSYYVPPNDVTLYAVYAADGD